MKAKIDNIHENSKCRFFSDKDKMINQIIVNDSKVAKKCMAKHDWGKKVIHWELRNKLKFKHNIK